MDIFNEFFQHAKAFGEKVVENASNVIKPPTPLEENLNIALSENQWGCSRTIYSDLLRYLSYGGPDADKVYKAIQEALCGPPELWKRAYRALLVVEYAMGHGDQVVEKNMLTLNYYVRRARGTCLQEGMGEELRKKGDFIISIMDDPEALASFKDECQKRVEKYVGISNIGNVSYGSDLPPPPSASSYYGNSSHHSSIGAGKYGNHHTHVNSQLSRTSSADPFNGWDNGCEMNDRRYITDTSSEAAYIPRRTSAAVATDSGRQNVGNMHNKHSLTNSSVFEDGAQSPLGDPFTSNNNYDSLQPFLEDSEGMDENDVVGGYADVPRVPQGKGDGGTDTNDKVDMSCINLLD